MNQTVKRALALFCLIVLVLGIIFGLWWHKVQAFQKQMKMAGIPPQTVATTHAAESVWQKRIHAVGSLAAVQGVMVSNQLAGAVDRIDFTSGQHVRRGDLLVQLDVSTDEAQLRALEAQADLARITLRRARELRASATNAQADLDAAKAEYRQAVANVDGQRALIAKKTIRAPFSGRLGIRQVDVGQSLPAGGAIAELQALDPIYINFSVPQQDVTDLRAGQPVQIAVDAYPGVVFAGTVTALNSTVDDATRNIEVQATLRNADERLVPGMFATVEVGLPKRDRYVTLPETAIVYNPYGDAVYVLEKASGGGALVARQRFVQLGDTRGDQVAIVKGLKPGEEVVTAGQIKLRNGSPVVVNNSITPPDNPAPTPPNN